MKIDYKLSSAVGGDFQKVVRCLARQEGVSRICDVGGGANPALPLDFVRDNDLDYVVLDISDTELAKTPPGYRTAQADVASPAFRSSEVYDLVLTSWVAEHVREPREFHSNILAMLADGGYAVHLFPTLYALPFVVNRLLPDRVTEAVLGRVHPSRKPSSRVAKFPAFYRWCRGPRRSQQQRFEELGFQVEEYTGYFGHSYYKGIRPLNALEQFLASALVSRPMPWLTSYAVVLLQKPLAAAGFRDERIRVL